MDEMVAVAFPEADCQAAMSNSTWVDLLSSAQADNSDGAAEITASERADLIAAIPPALNATAVTVCLDRYMATRLLWLHGIAPPPSAQLIPRDQYAPAAQYLLDSVTTFTDGYDSVDNAIDGLVSSSEDLPEGAVCAKVRLRISQELVLTRQGFEARLEMDNNGGGDLTGVSITVSVFALDGTTASQHFSIGLTYVRAWQTRRTRPLACP